MDYTITKRKAFYNKITSFLDKSGRSNLNLVKQKVLGKGVQGTVSSYCDKKTCVAVKKTYLDKKTSKMFEKPFSKDSLNNEPYIELAATILINQIILQKICPQFVLHYKYTFQKREGPCQDEFPYSGKFYNELITDVVTYTDWVQKKRPIEHWFNAYFQIVTGIYCLQKHFNMIHLDLHSHNILVKSVKPGGYWKYKINGVTYNVPNYGYIFFINDYGHSWIPNILQSWYAREKRGSKRLVRKNFDIKTLFHSTLDISQSPPNFKKLIRGIIKDLSGDKDFNHIMENMWSSYKTKIQATLIESYDLDKRLNKDSIPNILKHLVIY